MGEPKISVTPVKIGLSRDEAAAHIGISAPTFDRLVASGKMPKPIKIFTRLVWDRRAIDLAFGRMGGDDVATPEPAGEPSDGW